MKSFIVRLLIFAALISLADLGWNYSFPENPVPHWWFIVLFFTGVTAGFHSVMMRNRNERPQVIVRSYMTGTVLRLFLFIIVLVLYRVISRPTLVPFAIAFIIHYFAFTFFEVSHLMKQFRNLTGDKKP